MGTERDLRRRSRRIDGVFNPSTSANKTRQPEQARVTSEHVFIHTLRVSSTHTENVGHVVPHQSSLLMTCSQYPQCGAE